MFLLIGLVVFAVALYMTVDRHYEKWKYAQGLPNTQLETPIKHGSEKWIRIALFVPAMVLFLWQIDFKWFNAAAVLFFTCAWVWFLNDGFFNTKRGRNWWYEGTIDKDESGLDNLKRELGPKWTKIVQIGLCIISTALYIMLWVY